jgi:hypothetical protein
LQEIAMLTAFFLIGPLGIGALFAFARFADRNFRDTALLEDCTPRIDNEQDQVC